MTPKEPNEKARKHLALMSWQLINCIAHAEASITEVLGNQLPHGTKAAPRDSLPPAPQPTCRGGELWAKSQYSAGRERLWLCHRITDQLGLVQISGSFWLTPFSSSNTQSRVPSTRPYPGVFCRSFRRRFHDPPPGNPCQCLHFIWSNTAVR